VRRLFILILLSAGVYAAPHITGLTEYDGETLISGYGFGSWNRSEILAWDDMEGYAVGNEIPGAPKIGSWHKFSQTANGWTIAALISDEYSISGNNSMWGHRGQRDWSGASVYFDDLDDLYVSFWFRFNHQGVGQVKLMQVKGNQLGSCTDYHPQIATGDMTSWWKSYVYLDEPVGQFGCSVTDPYRSNYQAEPTEDSWHFFEAAMTESSPGESDGSVEIRVDGVRQFYDGDILTRASPLSHWNLVQILNGMTNFDSSNTWIDDYYVARNFSRVMICDKDTYQASTACMIQIPSSWSDEQVSFTKRSLDSSSHIYVIDSDGIISNGFPIGRRCISLPDLQGYIHDWMDSRMSLAALMESIRIWKDGCPDE
jgi:hypothetical protein